MSLYRVLFRVTDEHPECVPIETRVSFYRRAAMARASASYDHEEIQEARSLLHKAMEVAGKKVLTSDEVRKKLPELKRILIMYGIHSCT